MTAHEALEISEMAPADLDEVLAIEQVSFPTPWTRKMFLEEMSNRNARLLVFRRGKAIAGYICFWEVLDEAHLMNIAVHPRHRSQGYGMSMMQVLENVSVRDGVKRVLLDVARRNVPARSLYKKCGFHSIGFRKKYYTAEEDDAIVMEKWLGPAGVYAAPSKSKEP